jgi:tRNA uridine 5-carboxymethylaminomethyl modification enzyme
MTRPFDIVVVGAGHAGVEAAVAASRMGCRVAVVTLHLATAGQMPCNPAIGGIGKGHLVAEIDALGGVQGWAADRSGLQFKTLNASRGPAVWGPRAQCDKERYSRTMGRLLRGLPGITVIEGEGVALGHGRRARDRSGSGRRLGGAREGGDPDHRDVSRGDPPHRRGTVGGRPLR